MSIRFAFVVLLMVSVASAQDVKVKKQELKDIEKKIQAQKKALHQAERSSQGILKSLQQMEIREEKLIKSIAALTKELDLQKEIIEQTQSDIRTSKQTIEQYKGFVRAHLVHLYTHGSINTLQTWFQKMDMNDRRRQNVWIAHWVEKEREQIETFEGVVQDLQEQEQALLSQIAAKEATLQEQTIQKNELALEKKKKSTLLASISSEKELYKQTLKELEEASLNMQRMINKMDLAPSVKGNRFEQARGTLTPPIQAKILRKYGSYNDETLKAKVYHKGIDYRAEYGQHVSCVYDGKVIYTGWFEGYGQVVIVDHGNHYYSLYAHLSEITVERGQGVSAATVLGKAGDSGSIKGTHLYFELRKKGVTVNPMPWFG